MLLDFQFFGELCEPKAASRQDEIEIVAVVIFGLCGYVAEMANEDH